MACPLWVRESILRKVPHRFEMTLLTASGDFSIRQLRSYCASLGGTGQILCSFEEWQRLKNPSLPTVMPQLIVYDTALGLTAPKLDGLRQAGLLLIVDSKETDKALKKDHYAPWQNDFYCRSSLQNVFLSPLVRLMLAQRVLEKKDVNLSSLLRWGHSSLELCEDLKPGAVSDLSSAFCRKLRLTREARRLTLMGGHFMEVFPERLGLKIQSLAFGSDGLTTGLIATLTYQHGPHFSLPRVMEEISHYDFPVTAINILRPGLMEFAGLVTTQFKSIEAHGKMFLVLGDLKKIPESPFVELRTSGWP